MGEAHHLTPDERVTLIKAARSILDSNSLSHIPIVAGTGAGSTRETIQLCKDAYDAGGEYALLIPASYYRYAMDEAAVVNYFTEVADASPIPIILYNCKSCHFSMLHLC